MLCYATHRKTTHRCAKREKKQHLSGDHGTYNHPCSCFYNVKTKKEREKNNTFQLTKRGVQYRVKKKALEKKAFRVVQPFHHPLSSSFKILDFNKPKGSYPMLLKSSILTRRLREEYAELGSA